MKKEWQLGYGVPEMYSLFKFEALQYWHLGISNLLKEYMMSYLEKYELVLKVKDVQGKY